MKSSTEEIQPIIGTAMGGGFYAGRIRIGGTVFALIVAPRFEGEHADAVWNDDYRRDVPGAKSYCDGLANTKAMAEAGSKLAQWALGLRIGGNEDWYIPSQDELEIIYRNLKPTTDKNSCWARSGINLSAAAPTRPYTSESPVQTLAEAFKDEGQEAFEASWYWSSTQHASGSGYAWSQDFYYGDQNDSHEGDILRARTVRRISA